MRLHLQLPVLFRSGAGLGRLWALPTSESVTLGTQATALSGSGALEGMSETCLLGLLGGSASGTFKGVLANGERQEPRVPARAIHHLT